MEELDALLTQHDAHQHKLLFFAPLSAELREQLRRFGEDRNRQLRALFARQLWQRHGAPDGTHTREEGSLPIKPQDQHHRLHEDLLDTTSTTTATDKRTMTMPMESLVEHGARQDGKPKRRRVEEVSTLKVGKERRHAADEKDEDEDEEEQVEEEGGTFDHHEVVNGDSSHQQVAEWAVLPTELWVHIISFLWSSHSALKRVATVSKTFRVIALSSVRSASLPRSGFLSLLGQLQRRLDFLRKHCRASLTSLDLPGWQDGGIGHDERAVNALLEVLHKEITQLPLHFPALRSLNLYRTGVTSECLVSFTRLEHLHTLGLNQCTKLNDETLRLLPPSITKLDLGGLPMTDEGMKLLPSGLTDLNLSSNNLITSHGLANLREHLPRTLVSLNLMHCYHLTEQHIAALPATLTSLNLSFSSLGQSLTPSCFQHLPRGLLRLWMRAPCAGSLEHFPTTLTSLTLLSCRHMSPMDFQRLGALTRLTRLTLEGCLKLGDGSSLGFLARLPQLEHLGLLRFPKITGVFFDWVPPSVREIKLGSVTSLRVQPSRELLDRCTIIIKPPCTASASLSSSSPAARARGKNPPVLRRDNVVIARYEDEEDQAS